MDRADIHREFLTLLLGLRDDRKIRQVRIVARLYNDELLGGDSTASTYVFLPDLRLVSAAAEHRYRYGFRKLTPKRATSNSGPRGDAPQVLGNPHEAELLSDWVNVWATNQLARLADRKGSHRFLPSVLDLADGLRQGRQAALEKLDLGDEGPLPDLRTMVIGHTHHARISVHRDTQSPHRDLVLMDCGAWIESCRFTGERATVPSCQIGILCGGDARIYQLDPVAPG